MSMTDTTPAMTLLRDILERFPQADPESEFYNDDINGCEAVNFISELVPEIERYLMPANHRLLIPPVYSEFINGLI
jgi:hypothetical protein